MKKNLLIYLTLFFFYSTVFAQSRVITGKVTDIKDNSPIPGVNVRVKGTTIGTLTNGEGAFRLSVPADAKTLTFSFIGYKEATLPIKGTVVNVQMESDQKQLSEVLVVGYGTQQRESVTSSIATVASKEIEEVPTTTFESALQGKAAGVFVQSNNGKLGQGINIQIRGAASISAGSQPLYVVDGIIINSTDNSNNGAATDPLADINFNDIESIEILKDASSAAIYGARGSNGVVIITTKKGKAGKAKINFTVQYGKSQPSRHRKFLNSQQWLQIEERAAVGEATQDFLNGFNPPEDSTLALTIADYKSSIESTFTDLAAGNTNWASTNTNWEKQAFQKAPMAQYDLNVSGGNDKTTYYIAGQYLDQKGILIANSFKRYSARLNLDTKLSDKFDIGMNMNFANTINHQLDNDDSFGTPLQLVALSPITPLIDPRTGLLSGTPTGNPADNAIYSDNYPLYYNSLLSVNYAYYHTTVYRTIGNVFANWKIVKGLTFRSEFGGDNLNQIEEYWAGSETYRNISSSNGYASNQATNILHYTVNNYFNYKNTFANIHALDVTAGTSYEYNNVYGNNVVGTQFPSDAYKNLFSAAQITAGNSTRSQYSFVSYFSRLNYAYNDKYLIQLSAREDASSRFGAGNRYGFFPAGSVGWIISKEDFMNDYHYLSNLKLRASYGALGLWSGAFGYNGVAGQAPAQLANPNLKWEKTLQFDAGLDIAFFNNRLSGSFDYYRKNTSDLLLNVNIPGTSGFATQTQNLGKLYNQGVELMVSSDNFVGKFKWTTSVNAAYNMNRVTFINHQILGTNDLNRVIEGQPIGVFYGREYAGVDPANGDALYYLNTKNPDGTINHGTTNDYNAAQNVVLGNPTPKWTGGITNTFSYKGFDLSVTLQGVYGNKIYNGGGQYMSAEASNGMDNQTIDQLKYWDKPGDITNIPEPRLFYANGTNPSSRYLYDGSYLRCKTVTFGYTFPKAWTSKLSIEKLRVFVNAYNLFIITKYSGWDPEVNADYQATNINLGVDFYSVPQPRTITFGLNVGF